jgi:hypothetical protein
MKNFIMASGFHGIVGMQFFIFFLSMSASAELSYPHNVSFYFGIDHG